MRLLNLNADYDPSSTQIPLALGDVFRQRGDTATALSMYRTALASDSTLEVARSRIADLVRATAKP